ncbi:MAG: Crp/Fnr family transcriptional regulator [Rhizomicrobium sp.]|jgi:CRP-like cAMP-binding protein
MAGDFLAILDKSDAGKTLALGAGQSVFRQGEPIRWLYRVLSGRVRLSRVLARGPEIALARAGAGDVLAEASVFATHYHCDAISEAQSQVHRYPMRDIRNLLKREPESAMAFSSHLAAELMDLRATVEIRAIRRADDRLLAWLRFRSRGNPPAYVGKGMWPGVAKQIGLTGESLYRALARLERAGKITRTDGNVVLAKGRQAS